MENKELLNERPEGFEGHIHHHGPHHHMRPLPLSEEMIASADVDTLFRICAHDMRAKRASFGMSQDAILRVLKDKEEISQMQLRHHLHVRPGSMSEIISKMEEKGLLIRERNDEDKRHCILRITEAGRNAATELKKPESFFKALSKEEQDTLAALLRKVVQAEHMD